MCEIQSENWLQSTVTICGFTSRYQVNDNSGRALILITQYGLLGRFLKNQDETFATQVQVHFKVIYNQMSKL